MLDEGGVALHVGIEPLLLDRLQFGVCARAEPNRRESQNHEQGNQSCFHGGDSGLTESAGQSTSDSPVGALSGGEKSQQNGRTSRLPARLGGPNRPEKGNRQARPGRDANQDRRRSGDAPETAALADRIDRLPRRSAGRTFR